MKKIALLLIIVLVSCVDAAPDTNGAAGAPDAGADEAQRKNIETFLLAPDAGTDDGRKGGETVPCNCD